MILANRYRPTGGPILGGMGEVTLCEDEHLQRKVIIKRLQAGVELRRLLDEQKALAKVRSKHVVQLYDIIDIGAGQNREKAIVLEFIDGQNLAPGQYKFGSDYLKVLWQIAGGLADIHESQIVHRDIKPQNIRKDLEGVIKIIDFGLARSNADAKTRSVIGTPIFMAPELWKSSTISFNSAIDVYAFGVTALALANAGPIAALKSQPPSPLDRKQVANAVPGLPPDLVELIHHCLDHDPRSRPSMATIKSQIGRHLTSGEHRALIVTDKGPHYLDKANRRVSVTAGTLGAVVIEYDNFEFNVTSVTGDVFINNAPVAIGNVVPACCVITFGSGPSRKFVTLDVSHPEVMA